MQLFDFVAIVGLFLLRVGVPLLITLLIGYFLRRLDAHWEDELRGQALGHPRAPGSHGTRSAGIPAATAGVDIPGQPCWQLKDCDTASREDCPAGQQPGVVCWLARRELEGKIPMACYHCSLFVGEQLPYGQEWELPH